MVEQRFHSIWVEGEISNLARPSSGHIYFSLKDSYAHVRCALFRSRNRLAPVYTPQNGQQVLVKASASLYEVRGDYQLIVEHIEPAGDGLLRLRFEELKNKLAAQGLFDQARKRDIPHFPRQIGIITSATGAAIRDLLSVLARRAPQIPVLIYPTAVQGEGAATQIAAMLRLANRRNECDVLIVARGGGSLEDLWSFNEEVVARAIADSRIPVVTGIGHEVDFTIADLVADLRAPTPSAAAEIVSPNRQEWLDSFEFMRNRLTRALHSHIQRHKDKIAWLDKRLLHPAQRIRSIAQRVDELEIRFINAHRNYRHKVNSRIETLHIRLGKFSPTHRFVEMNLRVTNLHKRLTNAVASKITRVKAELATVTRTLEAVSPLATLHRGYAIVSQADQQNILRDAAKVKRGDKIYARLSKGRIYATVDLVEPERQP